MELELKYQILDENVVLPLTQASFWSPYSFQLEASQSLNMMARYYDTKDFKLASIGASLRIRQENSTTQLTLKLPALDNQASDTTEALFVRQEFQWTLDLSSNIQQIEAEAFSILLDNYAQLPSSIQSILDQELVFSLIYEARFKRQVYYLHRADERFELSFDQGHLNGRYANEEIFEMEIELKEGQENCLLELDAIVSGVDGLCPQNLSKAARLARLSTIDLVVVGAGAAGVSTALAYREKRPTDLIYLIDANLDPARKLAASGNGRGNLLNLDIQDRHYHHAEDLADPAFIKTFLKHTSPNQVRERFRSYGLYTRVEDGRVYPYSYQAKSAVQALMYPLETDPHTSICTNTVVVDVDVKTSVSEKRFVVTLDNGEVLLAKQLVLACGGVASPKLAKVNNMYDLAAKLGHFVTKRYPGLVQLKAKGLPKRLSGQRVQAETTVLSDGQQLANDYGELLFTDYGLSGIPILNLSHYVSKALAEGRSVELSINLLADLDQNEQDHFVEQRCQAFPDLKVQAFAQGLLSEKVAGALVTLAEVGDERSLRDLSVQEKIRLQGLCTNLTVAIRETRAYDFAQISCGGVSTFEVDPKTFMSKMVPGLFICGELLDVHGDCGGYNLYFAFNSGEMAGHAAALREETL